MATLTVKVPAIEQTEYTIHIESALLETLLDRVETQFPGQKPFVVTDQNLVDAGHLDRLLNGQNVPTYIINPPGEVSKLIQTAVAIVEAMEAAYLGRDSVVVALGGALFYATLDPMMPRFGDPRTPAQTHVAPQYLKDTVPQGSSKEPVKVGIPNVVTTVLASYRGYDTLGETVVIFTAGIAVLLLLGQRRRRRRDTPGQNPSGNKDADRAAGAED